MIKIITMMILFVVTSTSYAGAGFYFNVSNNMQPSNEDANYPQFTIHTSGGSDCWYNNDMDDWNKVIKPGESTTLYTERKNSLGCFVMFTDPASIGLGYFIKTDKNSEWKQLGNSFTLFNSGNNESNFYTYGKEPRSFCLEPCFPFEKNQFTPAFDGHLIFSDYQFWAMGTNGSNRVHITVMDCNNKDTFCF